MSRSRDRRSPGRRPGAGAPAALGEYWLACDRAPELLFTENETNAGRLWGMPNRTPYVKDAFNEYVVHGGATRSIRAAKAPRTAAHYGFRIAAGGTASIVLRLSAWAPPAPLEHASELLVQRQLEADRFYASGFGAQTLSEDERRVQRQAFAGLLWTEQVYIWDVERGSPVNPAGPPPPPSHSPVRNVGWWHFNTVHVLSMPDSWEYPWFAAWDLAFHCVPLALLDPEWPKIS